MNTKDVFRYADKTLDPVGVLFFGLTWLVCRWGNIQLDQDELFVIILVLGAARVVWERYKRKHLMHSPQQDEPPEPKHL